ncbi:MAG: nuclear transport factor 2 family protein [Alphaproteobacteria bacterium]
MTKIGLVAAIALTAAATGIASAQSPAAGLTKKPAGVTAVEFLDMAFNQKKVDDALARYVAAPYIQHNPQVPDGVEGARIGLGGLLKAAPAFHYEFKQVLVDGDLVAVHSKITSSPTDRGTAVVDIFRVKRGKLVEHWDVLQAVPETASNKNTMF